MSALRSIARALPLALLLPAAAAAQRVSLTGDAAIYDLVGQVRLQPGSGGAVVVDASIVGEDAGKVRLQSSAAGAWQVLRVVFPGGDIVYPALGRRSSSTMDVRDNGTFGDEGFWREEGNAAGQALAGGSKHRVRVSGDGSGLRAHADLVVQVPAGHRVALFLGIGRVDAENVDGRLRVSTTSGDVAFTNVRGSNRIATGSGDVKLVNGGGELVAATGSGDMNVQGARGTTLSLHTGSGDIKGGALTLTRVELRTGSGNVELNGLAAPDASIGTGSGDIQLTLTSVPDSLKLSTGSGDVRLTLPATTGAKLHVTTGTGDIDSDFPVTTTRHREGLLEGTIGNGRATITVSTGSGDVDLVKR